MKKKKNNNIILIKIFVIQILQIKKCFLLQKKKTHDFSLKFVEVNSFLFHWFFFFRIFLSFFFPVQFRIFFHFFSNFKKTSFFSHVSFNKHFFLFIPIFLFSLFSSLQNPLISTYKKLFFLTIFFNKNFIYQNNKNANSYFSLLKPLSKMKNKKMC